MINKLGRFFQSILFFYILFFISNAVIVIGLSNLTEAKNITEEHYFIIISIIGALMLIISLSVIFTPPILRLKDIFHAFILRKTAETNTPTSGISPHRIPPHISFIENLVIIATITGILFIGIIIYVLFNLYFKKIVFLE